LRLRVRVLRLRGDAGQRPRQGYRNLRPITPGAFGYSVLRSSVHAELHQALLDLCEEMRMPLEGLHTETGAGVLERR